MVPPTKLRIGMRCQKHARTGEVY